MEGAKKTQFFSGECKSQEKEQKEGQNHVYT